MSHLINSDMRTWDNSLLNNVLSHADANIVNNIHLSKKSCDDKLIWRDTTDGVITVKSTYAFERSSSGMMQTGTTSSWVVLWNANVAPKLNCFGGGFCIIFYQQV